MKLKFNDKEFPEAAAVLCGFTTPAEGEEDKEATHFNLVASPDLQFNVAMQLIQTMTINVFQMFITQHPEAKEHVYDAYNLMASSVLETIIPESEISMTLEEEAILMTEQKLIEDKYDSLSDEQKEIATERIERIKARLATPQTEEATETIIDEEPSTL